MGTGIPRACKTLTNTKVKRCLPEPAWVRLLLFRCKQCAGMAAAPLPACMGLCRPTAFTAALLHGFDGQTLSLLFGAGTQGTEEHFNSQGIICRQRKSFGNERIARSLYPVSSSNARSPVRVSRRLLRSVKPSWGINKLAALGHVP